MAFSLNLKPLLEFDPEREVGASISARWRQWLNDFDTFLLASGIRDNRRKRALLLYQAGSRVREIFAQLPDTGEDDDYSAARTKLTEYFEPQKNTRYEVYKFRQTRQEVGETLDTFYTRLRKLSVNCEFADADFEIEEQIIIGGLSSRIRKKALREPEYKLKDMLLDGRRDEMSEFQARDIESKDETPITNRVRADTQFKKSNKASKCGNCGGAWHPKDKCPAQGKTCRKCSKNNHFARVCRSSAQDNQQKPEKPKFRKQNTVKPLHHSETDSSDEEYVYAVKQKSTGCPTAKVYIGGSTIQIMIDTGASINVLDYEAFEKLNGIKLQPTKVQAFPFNTKQPVHFKGKFETLVESKKKYCLATFYVMKEQKAGCLLSANTAQELGLISLNLSQVHSSNTTDDNVRAIIDEYKQVFEGLGKLKDDDVKLNIDNEAIPQAQQPRRIPFHIRKKVKDALKELQHQGIIEPVPANQPTPWLSPIVAVPKKDGSVRICVDMRMANQAINRVRYPIPTVNDISLDLNGAKYFSKLDLAQAYHQLPLAEESRYITAFSTHVGLYRYKRLAYGVNASAEIFQHALQQNLQGIKGVRNIADDIIVYGSTRNEHDTALKECLHRLQQKGLTLNAKKCKFLQPTLEFFGQIFSADGTRPDPKRIEDFQNAAQPTNAQEVRSLLGMSNYSSKYIHDYATLTAPLRELTKKNARFSWEQEHQRAFDKLKQALVSAPVMGYFDTQKDTMLTVDASPVGVSAILAQSARDQSDYKVIAYASRSLSNVERRYSQTEKEALSIVWAVEHFHLFLYGQPFTLFTDHKPLEIIYGSPKSKPSARIERWVLRLQPYTFTVKYKPGKENAADYLSRHPSYSQTNKEKHTEQYINFVTVNAVPKAMSLSEIARATNEDKTLQLLRAALRTDIWNSDLLKQYKMIKEELTIGAQNVILRGSRIVIPQSLQQRIIDIAHESHQGLSKTKAMIREKVWFPKIDEAVKATLDSCLACQATGKQNPPEPVKLSEMPRAPWEKLHADFYGPLPSGDYLLVVIDRYSRFPEVEFVKSTKLSVLIPKFDRIFAVHGIPEVIKTDNGPPFNSDDFSRYLIALGIKHDPTTPVWPQANGEVERFNQPLGKVIQAALIEGRPWRQEIQRFLLQYRTTPHSVTKVAPCELLFNRQVRGKLPVIERKIVVNKHKQARANEIEKQKYQKEYTDMRRNAKESDIKVGDTVLVKQIRKNKLYSRFNKTPYIVIERKGTTITAENANKHRITRNVSHFKKYINRKDHTYETESDLEDTDRRDKLIEQADQVDEPDDQERQIENDNQPRETRTRKRPERYGNPIPT